MCHGRVRELYTGIAGMSAWSVDRIPVGQAFPLAQPGMGSKRERGQVFGFVWLPFQGLRKGPGPSRQTDCPVNSNRVEIHRRGQQMLEWKLTIQFSSRMREPTGRNGVAEALLKGG